jgi:hypothetical protein
MYNSPDGWIIAILVAVALTAAWVTWVASSKRGNRETPAARALQDIAAQHGLNRGSETDADNIERLWMHLATDARASSTKIHSLGRKRAKQTLGSAYPMSADVAWAAAEHLPWDDLRGAWKSGARSKVIAAARTRGAHLQRGRNHRAADLMSTPSRGMWPSVQPKSRRQCTSGGV